MKLPMLRFVVAASLIAAFASAASPKPGTMPMARPAVASAPGKTAWAHVDAAWVRAAPPGATMLAGYMVVHNDGRTALRFVSAQSDAFGMIQLHRSLIVDGMETMRPAGEQTIPAGGSLKIVPGGLHLMLMQPTHALKIGEMVHFRLQFADGRSMDVVAPVAMQAPGMSAR